MRYNSMLFLAILVVSGFQTTNSFSTTYRLDALSLAPASYGDFSVSYNDLDNDTLLSLSEVISFSGIVGVLNFNNLTSIPNIPGFADNGSSSWFFRDDATGTLSVADSGFGYQKSVLPTPPAVPNRYRLDAISADPGSYGNFSVEFEDLDHNQILGFDEVQLFSGIFAGTSLTNLTSVPNVAGFADGFASTWFFRDDNIGTLAVEAHGFTFQLTLLPTEAVPLPATGIFLVTAMVAAAGIACRSFQDSSNPAKVRQGKSHSLRRAEAAGSDFCCTSATDAAS